MYAAHAEALQADSTSFVERVNGPYHELALRTFMVIVLAHWAEHLLQAFQIYALGWPVPEARGLLGYYYPWLIKSETLHYGYALVMLAGLWLFRPGFTGVKDRRWWTLALGIQFFHHIEHFLLIVQATSGPQLLRTSGTDEPHPAVGASRRAPSVLQHHRFHPDDHRDVLPPLSAR